MKNQKISIDNVEYYKCSNYFSIPDNIAPTQPVCPSLNIKTLLFDTECSNTDEWTYTLQRIDNINGAVLNDYYSRAHTQMGCQSLQGPLTPASMNFLIRVFLSNFF